MLGLLCGTMWIEDPYEAKGKHEFSGKPAAHASYREGPGVLLSRKPTMSQQCVLVGSKVKISLGNIRKSVVGGSRGVQLCPVGRLGEATCGGLCYLSRMCNTVAAH